MRRIATFAGLALALALPATAAGAGKIALKGEVVGVPTSGVAITITKDQASIGKITKLNFNRVPLSCSDGQTGVVSGSSTRSFEVRGKNFTRRTRIAGPGIQNGFFRVSGKFRRGGRVAKGFVRFSLKTTTGAGCGSDNVRWKAAK